MKNLNNARTRAIPLGKQLQLTHISIRGVMAVSTLYTCSPRYISRVGGSKKRFDPAGLESRSTIIRGAAGSIGPCLVSSIVGRDMSHIRVGGKLTAAGPSFKDQDHLNRGILHFGTRLQYADGW